MTTRSLTHGMVPMLVTGALLAACASPTAVPAVAPVEPLPMVETVAPPATAMGGTEVILLDPASLPADPSQAPVPSTCAASERVPRAGVYRCTTDGGGVFDPCFSVGAGILGCEPNPVMGSWTSVVQSTGPLPESVDRTNEPVAFYLELGTSYPPCSAGTTAPKELDSQVVTFTCQAPGAWILGPLDTSTARWTAQYVTTDTQGETVTSGPTATDITRAWTY